MDSIKQKWKNYALQKKLKDLWDDYKKVSHLEDDPETLMKFKIFLEQANQTIKTIIKNNDLDSVLSDADDILKSVLEYLSKFQQIQIQDGQLIQDIFDQCVQLAEYILRDPKYRKSIENSHNILSDFLNLVEKAQKSESKVIIVKLLVLFSETLNQRVEFFEQQGFSRLLQILLTKDPQLTRVISKALLHFLSIEDIQILDNQDNQNLKQKLSKIAFSFRKFAFNELSKVFLQQQQQIVQVEQKEQQIIITSLQQAIEQQLSAQIIFETDLSIQMNMQSQSRSTSDQDMEQGENDLTKEFLVIQGGFKAILDMILKATSEVQLNLLSTIQQVLLNNQRNRVEFKKVNGYQSLQELIISKENDQEFFGQFLQFLKSIILLNDEIEDYDAFSLLLDLTQNEQALTTLIDILQLNWKNVLIAQRLKLNFYLALLYLRQYYSSDELQFLVQGENEYITSNFQQIKAHFAQSSAQIQQLQTIYEQINQLEGFYNLEFEAIQSQITIAMFGKESFQQQYNFFIQNIQSKLHKKCKIINSFDHLSEQVFRNVSIIFLHVYEQYLTSKKDKQQNQQQPYINFIQIISIINSFINCDHQVQNQDNQFIKNLVSQNRCEQISRLLEQPLKELHIEKVIKLFDFEKKNELAITHLQYRINQELFDTMKGMFKVDARLEPQITLYLTFSQYEMWLSLDQQPQNPINQMIEFLMVQNKLQVVQLLMQKITLLDENAACIDFITKSQEQKEYLMIQVSRNLPQYFNFVNLYPTLIQFLESQLQKNDIEPWLDFVFSSDAVKRVQEPNVGAALTDILSLITIHSVLQGQVYDKMLTQEYLTNALQLLTYDSTREQAIKLVYILYLSNQKFKKNAIYTNKQKFFQLMQKLIYCDANNQLCDNQICNTIYKLIFWNFDCFHILYTENSSNVSSIIVRSEFADTIQKIQKTYIETKQPIQNINNVEILELFFQVLARNPSNAYIYEILKIFESILNSHNLGVILESNIIQWLQRLNRNDQKITNQINVIIRSMITFDLLRSPKLSKIVEVLKRYNSTDIIIDYFQQLKENPIIKQEQNNFVKNLANVIQNLEDLVGYSEECEIILLQVINLMASKNSPDIRTLMKSLGYLEIRDNLAIQVMRYNIPPDEIMSLLSGIAFAQICNLKQFKENHCLAYLLKRLIQHKDHFGLTILIIKILKYDVSQNEDNRKYVAKILQHDQLIQFFYPQMGKKSSKSLQCFEKEQQRSNSPDQFNNVDSFIQTFFSVQYEDERKQIDLFLEKVLIPVENEFKKQALKLQQKKTNRLQKLEDQQEQLKTQTIINEWELKIQQRLKRSSEKHKARAGKLQEQLDQYLGEGENQFFNIQ
ncbi:hypothetical protein pb186bvf_007678 [Paramecium bursaria]